MKTLLYILIALVLMANNIIAKPINEPASSLKDCEFGCASTNSYDKCTSCNPNPCDLVTAVSVPINGNCSTTHATCSSKCSTWACNSGYNKSGNNCVKCLGGKILDVTGKVCIPKDTCDESYLSNTEIANSNGCRRNDALAYDEYYAKCYECEFDVFIESNNSDKPAHYYSTYGNKTLNFTHGNRSNNKGNRGSPNTLWSNGIVEFPAGYKVGFKTDNSCVKGSLDNLTKVPCVAPVLVSEEDTSIPKQYRLMGPTYFTFEQK